MRNILAGYGRVMGVAVVLAAGLGAGGTLRGGTEVAKPAAKNEVFEAIKGLSGTWVMTKAEEGKKPKTVVFKTTSGGGAVIESMFPGEDCEMVNMFTTEGNSVVMTHYCAMGNQPRMKASTIDKGVIKFAYVDGGNIKSRDEEHMDSVEITIAGDKLIEKWSSYANGKSTGEVVFELKKQK